MDRLNTQILRVYTALRTRLERQEGQALVEYALILALIAILSIVVLRLMGVNVSRIFNTVNTSLDSVGT